MPSPLQPSVSNNWEFDESIVLTNDIRNVDKGVQSGQIRYWPIQRGMGYRYGKPMAEEAFLPHMAAWQPEQCPCPAS